MVDDTTLDLCHLGGEMMGHLLPPLGVEVITTMMVSTNGKVYRHFSAVIYYALRPLIVTKCLAFDSFVDIPYWEQYIILHHIQIYLI